MASLAKVTLIGNLGRDAELKYLPSGAPVLEFSIATNERSRDGQEHTMWFRVSLFGRQAESLKEYLVKGKQVYVDGRLRVRDYTTQAGEKGYSLDVRADQVTLLGMRGEGGGGQQGGEWGGGYGGQRGGGGGQQGGGQQGGGHQGGSDTSYSDDDIPF